jgi:hypothetical protein
MLVGTVHFTWRDEKQKESFSKIRIPSALTFTQYKAFGAAAAAVLNDMSTCELIEVSVAVGLDLSGADLKSVATQFADWFTKGFISASNAINGLVGKFIIPTYDDNNNTAGSKNMNLADPDVAALTTLITDGLDVSGTLIFPVAVRGDALTNIDIAQETFRKS